MRVVEEDMYKGDLNEIISLFPNVKRIFSRNSIVLDTGKNIVKIDTKERIFNEIKYMRAFSIEFNVPKIVRKRLIGKLAYIVMEKVKAKSVFKKIDASSLRKKLIKVALKYKASSSASELYKNFNTRYDVILGKKVFVKLIKKCYFGKNKIDLYLLHGDLHGNVVGTARKYYLIDFETAGYREIEYEIAMLKYIDSSLRKKELLELYTNNFKMDNVKTDLYGIGLLNHKLFMFSYNPIEIIKKIIYLYKLMRLIHKYN